MGKIIGIFFLGAFAVAAADLRTNQLFIGDTPVESTVSNGTIVGDRWMVISNTLVRIHAEVTPLDGPARTDSKDDSEPALRLLFQLGQGPTKDKSTMHGGVHGLHGLLYMSKGLNTPHLDQMTRVDVFSTVDKAIIVLMVRDNGPIYSSTNSGMTWAVINQPGTYEIPMSTDSDGSVWLAGATIHPSPANQNSPTGMPPPNWYAVGNDPDGSKLVLSGNSSPALKIKASGKAVILTWPTNFTGFAAQQCRDLAEANWVDVTNSASVVGDENQVIISPATDNCFYRLKSLSQ